MARVRISGALTRTLKTDYFVDMSRKRPEQFAGLQTVKLDDSRLFNIIGQLYSAGFDTDITRLLMNVTRIRSNINGDYFANLAIGKISESDIRAFTAAAPAAAAAASGAAAASAPAPAAAAAASAPAAAAASGAAAASASGTVVDELLTNLLSRLRQQIDTLKAQPRDIEAAKQIKDGIIEIERQNINDRADTDQHKKDFNTLKESLNVIFVSSIEPLLAKAVAAIGNVKLPDMNYRRVEFEQACVAIADIAQRMTSMPLVVVAADVDGARLMPAVIDKIIMEQNVWDAQLALFRAERNRGNIGAGADVGARRTAADASVDAARTALDTANAVRTASTDAAP